MRVSDWSSDVCSSDLRRQGRLDLAGQGLEARRHALGIAVVEGFVGGVRRGQCGGDGADHDRGVVGVEPEVQVDGLMLVLVLFLVLMLVFMRSEEHTSELQSLMRISYAVFCLQKKTITIRLSINIQLDNT